MGVEAHDLGSEPEARSESSVSVVHELAAAQAITHIGSWEWDARTSAVRWSDELYRIYGLEPQSSPVTLESFLARVHPDDRERASQAVATAFSTASRFAYTERIVRPDGTVRVLESAGEPRLDPSGQLVGLRGTCRDITEEHARQQELQLYADIVRNVQIGLAVWTVASGSDEPRLAAFNPAAERLAGRSLTALVGRPFHEVIPYAAGGVLDSMIRAVAVERRVLESTVEQSRDPNRPTLAVSYRVFPLSGGSVGAAIEDVTDRTLNRRMQASEQRVLEMIAEGASLYETLRTLVSEIESQSPPARASIFLLDDAGRFAPNGVAPSMPESYVLGVAGQPVGPRAGSCGTAAFRRSPVVVEDVETDPLWDEYRELARSAGVRACWSTPILSRGGRVLGTFAVHYPEPRRPGARELGLIARATHVARLAIERRQLIDELRGLSARVESAREDERAGIAREIHDELGQALTALKMDLAWLRRQLTDAAEVPAAALVEKIRAMTVMTDQVIDHVRRISSDLRPGVLDDLGLVAAIEWEAQQFEGRTGLICAVRSSLPEATSIERALATAVFRIFQEALTNVVRHSGAGRVDVDIDERDGDLWLEVRDDGRGIAAEAIHSPTSLGLFGIRERARRFGGSATVAMAAPSGTLVSVRIPLKRGGHD